MRKAYSDISFWLLIALNLYSIYYFYEHPDGFKTVVWLYWIQSVLIGIFNFLELLTARHPDPASMSINDQPIDGSLGNKGCTSLFFLLHYQFFHLVYGVFLLIKVPGSLDISLLYIAVPLLIVELSSSFIRNKIAEKDKQVNYGMLFTLPYLRIIPMHLMILAPAFLGWTPSSIFLILKTLADIGMYMLTRNLYYNKKTPVNH